MRVAMGITYHGQAYQGWQSQPSGQTVQDKLELALGKFTQERISTLCAGRTDAGVHAHMQVVHFDTTKERTAFAWLQLENGVMATPADPGAAVALLAGYRSVSPLTPDDVETIARLLPLVHIEFALSEVDYFAGIVSDHAQAVVAWQGYCLDHGDWFLSPAGQHVLQQFRLQAGV